MAGGQTSQTGRGAAGAPRAANRLGLDYGRLASLLPGPIPDGGIIDAHAHIYGRRAAAIWLERARVFGISRVHTMVRLDEAAIVREVLGDAARFIAFPNFRDPDRARAFGEGFLEDIAAFRERFDARMVKFWNAPRLRELVPVEHHAELIEFDSPWRVRQAELAERLGMAFMAHVADPDAWFATKYKDAARFGEKRSHYRGLRAMLDRFKGPWIGAHMGGCPEDLAFLSELLAAHPNLYLDTSATKWVARELSRHPRELVREFFERWRGRILFGSDIVTTDEHLAPPPPGNAAPRSPMADLADSEESAAELYASRYFVLRVLLETGYEGESPIDDPDLDPAPGGEPTPWLRGLALPPDVLSDLYSGTANSVLGPFGWG